jgi:hypothetical protein
MVRKRSNELVPTAGGVPKPLMSPSEVDGLPAPSPEALRLCSEWLGVCITECPHRRCKADVDAVFDALLFDLNRRPVRQPWSSALGTMRVIRPRDRRALGPRRRPKGGVSPSSAHGERGRMGRHWSVEWDDDDD